MDKNMMPRIILREIVRIIIESNGINHDSVVIIVELSIELLIFIERKV
jgi:hypothetical protein